VSLVLDEQFTGTNGAAPNASIWTVGSANGSSATIQSNKLRLSLVAVQYTYASITTGSNLSSADIDVRIDMTVNATAADAISTLSYRMSSDGSTGYVIEINSAGGWQVSSRVDYSPFMSGSSSVTSGDTLHMRLQVIGSAHKVKTWVNAAGEPGTWGAEQTNATHSATGRLQFSIYSNVATTGYTDLDFITVDDTVAGANQPAKRFGGVPFAGAGQLGRW